MAEYNEGYNIHKCETTENPHFYENSSIDPRLSVEDNDILYRNEYLFTEVSQRFLVELERVAQFEWKI